MENNKNQEEHLKGKEEEVRLRQIDVVAIAREMRRHRKAYLVALPATFVLSCLLILCVPRYYASTAKLAPEISSFSTSSLSDIASSFGFDLGGSSANGDAIFPELYPELIATNDFMVGMFDVRVKSKDGSLSTTYYDYLATKRQVPWWTRAFGAVRKVFAAADTTATQAGKKANPFQLTKRQDEIVKLMMDNIKCDVDKKNYVISITVEDQDPLVCATLADTVQAKLQAFITDYRTKKAKKDLEYYQQLSRDAKQKYERIRQQYGSYSDANQDVVLESYRLKANDMENEMQLLYNTYTTLQAQVQQAQARLLMQTPAFTTLQSASVPVKPAGPKRMLFVLGMTFLAFVVVSAYAVRGIIFKE